MAARLVLADPADGRTLGEVRASDADETLLVGFLTELEAAAPGFTAQLHGSGTLGRDDVARLRELDAQTPLAGLAPPDGGPAEVSAVARWASVLSAVLGSATGPLAWTMTYDVGGSVDDGASEFVTGADVA